MRAKTKYDKDNSAINKEKYGDVTEELVAFMQLLKKNDELRDEVTNMRNMLDEVMLHEIEQEHAEEQAVAEKYEKIFSFPRFCVKKDCGMN